jgi:hypothetical protein
MRADNRRRTSPAMSDDNPVVINVKCGCDSDWLEDLGEDEVEGQSEKPVEKVEVSALAYEMQREGY